MNLTDAQRRHLRSLAHPRKPIVTIGRNGLTDAVLAELELALTHHELVKIKVNIGDREVRNGTVEELCERTGAARVQRVGYVATLFRRNPDDPKVSLDPA
ncbi:MULTISPECIES: ribosome assembly RNA-binding protein YhbY [Thioalkalivibrio]|uniref:ribosome assembly RNA-binding protein YhbY n=1 Tax=Thioalkalivibrio TaxID=106633 RepID=UPI00037DBD70|nr:MULTISPECIES: ribosome assembly RNA-binding protein YhbY [Thioalkalivibrio]OOC48142.1 RNA-binding protein [Thioalkalivibrio versutus]